MNALVPVLLLSFLIGQTEGTNPPPSTADDLGPEYVDGTYGISLRPPQDWRLDRQRVAADGSTTLLRMFETTTAGQQGRSITLSIQMDDTARTIERRLSRKVRGIEFDHSDADVLSQQVQTIAEKPGALLSASLMDAGSKRFRMLAMIEIRPRQYFELSYDGPFETKAAAERMFYLVLGSIRLLVDPIEESEMAAALDHGKEWLGSLSADALETSLDGLRFLEIRMKNEPVGIIRIEESAHTWKKRAGVRIRERTWTFNQDGSATRTQATLFVGDDLQCERWKESVTTLLPAREGRAETIENAWEEGLRDGEVLLTNQTYQLGVPPKENPPVRTPATYLPRAVARLLPRLIGNLDKPRKVAFTAFDHERAGLIVRTFELKGKAPPPTGVSRGEAFRIEEREGVMAVPSVVFVDSTGRVLHIESGDMTIVPAQREDLERRFGDRIQQAEARMTALETAYRENEKRFGR